jgi:hypothetical protein
MNRPCMWLAVTAVLWNPAVASAQARPSVRFEVSFPAAVSAEAVTGRVYVMITRNGEREPRLQLNQVDGIPFFGRDVQRVAPGAVTVVDDSIPGFPVASLRDIPPGEYYVQAFVNVYSEFKRADGHILWMHDDQWEGQRWETSPGNLYSRPQKIRLDASTGYRLALIADQKIPPVAVPADTQYVKRIKFQSPMLTTFWGRPVFIGATVLLPRDYDTETMSYPVLYMQGHFSLAAPIGLREGSETYQAWMKADFPRMIVVTFQHPNPYYDDSYAVNSANVGDMDTHQLDKGVVLLDQWMKTTTNPHYPGFFMYGDRKPHCWSGPVTQSERLKEMAQFVMRKKPAGATTPW